MWLYLPNLSKSLSFLLFKFGKLSFISFILYLFSVVFMKWGVYKKVCYKGYLQFYTSSFQDLPASQILYMKALHFVAFSALIDHF